MPRVTILLNVYNQERFVGAAVESALAQTFSDFELLVVDDRSTDSTREIVERFRDPRLRLLVTETNRGLGAAINHGLRAARGEYVARLDGDDLSFPQRLERQVAFLDAHAEVAVVGAQATYIDVAGRTIGRFWRPVTPLGIRWCRIFGSPLIHSSVLFRRAVVWDELRGYDDRYRVGEDFDLWCRLAKSHTIANLPETLAAYRIGPHSITATPRPAARDGYPARKEPMIFDALCDALQSDDVPRAWLTQWLALADPNIAQSGAEVRDVVAMIERCAERFGAVRGANEETARLQAMMLIRALDKALAAGRVFVLRVWLKAWRRHRATAWRARPRFAVLFVFGSWPLRLRRALRR